MSSIPSNKILFFDFDSTLADTEPYHTYARDTVLGQFMTHLPEIYKETVMILRRHI